MDNKVNYTVIGSFVIILFSFFVLGIIWLSSGFSNQTYSTYQVNMQEAVTGLNQDAVVEFNGVNVGNVKSIKLNKKNPNFVELLLDVQSDTPVTQGTIATLSTRGITGITYISLKDKGSDLRPLKAFKGQSYPIIPTGPSIFLQIDTALRDLTNSLKQVSETFKSIFDTENLRSIKQILKNTSRISDTLAINSDRLTGILENTEIATSKFPMLIQSSERTMQMLQTRTLPETNRMISNIDSIADNLSVLSTDLRTNPSILIRGKQPSPLGPGEK